MKQLIRNALAVALGAAMVAPAIIASPAAVNGTLGGFSANAQGGQNPADWGIPQSSSQSGAGQNANSGGGQNGPGQQSSQANSGQNGPGQQSSQSNSGQNGPGQQSSQSNSGQNGAGEGQAKGGEGNGQNGQGSAEGEGPTKNNSNNPDGDGSQSDGPTKNNSNNPDGDSGSAEGEGPTKNNSNNPDGGNGNGGSSSGSSGGHGGSNDGGDFPQLDPPTDGQYDPSDNGGEQQVPSGCAEAGSQCAQCVQRNEGVVQFNRRYLHVAWSTTHQAIEYANRAIAFGDAASGIHSTQALAWQLAGKPQITEALTSLRKTYDNKYRIYINNMEQALSAMNRCETENFAVQDLYQRFSSLYLEFVKARYQSPD